MKYLPLLFCSLFPLCLSAQYIPLIAENKYWIIEESYSNDIPITQRAFMYTFEGDTAIGNYTYQKLMWYDLDGSYGVPQMGGAVFYVDFPYTTITKGARFALLREDTLEQKVYHLPSLRDGSRMCATEEEYLLYDFSLAVGDPLDSCQQDMMRFSSTDSQTAHFGFIDSIGVYNAYGKERNYLFTTGWYMGGGLPSEHAYRFVAGIGWPEMGIFPANNRLLRLADFCEGSLAQCNIVSSVERPQTKFQISPNPTFGPISIQSTTPPQRVTIMDVQGRVIQETRSSQIDLTSQPAGIYLLKLEDYQGDIHTHRVIKSD